MLPLQLQFFEMRNSFSTSLFIWLFAVVQGKRIEGEAGYVQPNSQIYIQATQFVAKNALTIEQRQQQQQHQEQQQQTFAKWELEFRLKRTTN